MGGQCRKRARIDIFTSKTTHYEIDRRVRAQSYCWVNDTCCVRNVRENVGRCWIGVSISRATVKEVESCTNWQCKLESGKLPIRMYSMSLCPCKTTVDHGHVVHVLLLRSDAFFPHVAARSPHTTPRIRLYQWEDLQRRLAASGFSATPSDS